MNRSAGYECFYSWAFVLPGEYGAIIPYNLTVFARNEGQARSKVNKLWTNAICHLNKQKKGEANRDMNENPFVTFIHCNYSQAKNPLDSILEYDIPSVIAGAPKVTHANSIILS